MIPKSVLDAAKAYLCWDVLPGLAIQLVPLKHALAYYYPPDNQTHSIVLFYDAGTKDFSESLYLLFHEAGHARQYNYLQVKDFIKMISNCKGPNRIAFEMQAWQLGRSYFIDFIENQDLSTSLLNEFDRYSRLCIESYTEK